MELIEQFKNYLFSQKKQASKVTIKNYTADIRHFIVWFEKTHAITFDPRLITTDHWFAFRLAKQHELSEKSLIRHLSSLRKFFSYFLATNIINQNPFDLKVFQIEHVISDPWQVQDFKEALRKEKVSKITIKNYGSDIQQFLQWIEDNKKSPAIHDVAVASLLNPYFLEQYTVFLKRSARFSQSSLKRKVSSIKKFITWTQKNQHGNFPRILEPERVEIEQQPTASLEALYNSSQKIEEKANDDQVSVDNKYQSGPVTVPIGEQKEVLSLIDAFVTGKLHDTEHQEEAQPIELPELQGIPEIIPVHHTEADKDETMSFPPLIEEPQAHAEQSQNLTQETPFHFLTDEFTNSYYQDNLINQNNQTINSSAKTRFLKKIPPVRLVWKIIALTNFLIDFSMVLPLVKMLEEAEYLLWKTKGKPVFAHNKLASKLKELKTSQTTVAKHAIGTTYAKITNFVIVKEALIKKHGLTIINYLSYRPAWYARYHRYAVVHYMHFAVLVVAMSATGYYIYSTLFPAGNLAVLGTATSGPPRILSFKGKLTDKDNNPITSPTDVRFAVYTNSTASGSAMIWQEVDRVTPDDKGNIFVRLGTKSALSPDVFLKNFAIWLGVTVGDANELRPRQQLANTALATSSQTLQGLSPITDPDAGTRNVVLALDSSGDLTINDQNDHTFRATGGSLTLSGNALVLQTNPGSSQDVQIAPDGLGEIDLQKPIHNTSNYSNIPSAAGAVEVDDSLAVLASTSGQSAFTINQNANSPLISASSSGTAKFTIENDGSIESEGNLSIKGLVNSDLVPFDDARNLGNTISQWNNLYVKNITLDGNQLTQTFLENSTTIFPINQTKNFAIGLNQNTIPNFQVTAATGDIATAGTITFVGTSSATIAAGNNQTLHLGNGTTSAVAISPNNQAGILVNGSGNVGIGTQNIADETALHIEKHVANSLVLANQTGTGNIFMGEQNSSTKFVIGNNGDTRIIGAGLCVSQSTICSSESLNQGTIYAQTVTPGNGDLAEKYVSAEQLEPGDIVIPADDGNNDAVVKSTETYQQQVLGVVSTDPGVVLNGDATEDFVHPYGYAIALSGRVPVKVSLANGPIRTGDLLTSSPVPGVAMKATEAGPIIGKALEDFTSTTPGKVMAYISISWASPHVSLADNGTINAPESLLLNQNSDQNISAKNFIEEIANQAQIAATNISSELISAKNIITGTETVNDKLISPVAEISMVYSNSIAPLSDNGSIALRLHNNSIDIANGTTASAAAVAAIDNDGNATFSGKLSADGLSIGHDATISGTLHVGKILASDIEGLATASPTINNITNIYYATPSGKELSMMDSHAIQTRYALENPNYIDVASMAAQLDYTPTLHIKNATIEQGFVSLGQTSLSDTSITGQLAIGGQFIIDNNSVNVLGGDLQLQPLQQGGVSIAGGQVYIDSTGNLTANGKATFNGVLAAHVVSPVPNQDLVVSLDNGNQTNGAAKLKVKNVSGNDIFSVNQWGDILASGAATISKLNFQVTKPALALSDTEMIASGSAGVATISASRTFVKIDNSLVTEKSLIYITPVGKAEFAPFLLQQVPHESFSVGIDQESIQPTTFNWLIIN